MVDHGERGLGGRGAGSRLVLTHRGGGAGLRHVGRELRPVQGRLTGIYGNDYAAELAKQGLSDDEILKRVVARDIELTAEAEEVSYQVFALDAQTGKVVWQREAHRGKPFGGRHRKNTYASETPATDGERLYASFGGNVGLFCYSLDGTLLWKRTWTPQPIYLDFGTASSPVVHGAGSTRCTTPRASRS